MSVITFILLIVLLFQPWLNSSSVAASSIEEVMIKKFLEIAESYNSTISSFLSRYMIAAKFLSGIMNDPTLMQCDLPYLPKLVRMATAVHKSLSPHPRYMYMWQENRFCQISWQDPDISRNKRQKTMSYLDSIKLASKPIDDTFLGPTMNLKSKSNKKNVILVEITNNQSKNDFQYEESNDLLIKKSKSSSNNSMINNEYIKSTNAARVVNEYDDSEYQYSDFTLNYIEQSTSNSLSTIIFNKTTNFHDPPKPIIFTSNTSINFEYSQYKVASWVTQGSFIDDGDPNNDLSANSPNIQHTDGKAVAVSGVVISLSQVANELRKIPDTFNCKYVVLNQNDEVLIDDEIGCHDPEYIDTKGVPHYQEFVKYTDFWNSLTNNKYDEILNHQVTKIEVNETNYMAINVPVSPIGYQLFTVILAFSVTESSQKYNYRGSIIFICSLTLLAVMFTILLLLLRKVKKRKKKKLAKIKPHEPKFRVIGMEAKLGVIGQSIQTLRNLQLRFPEKEIFNKMMDDAISNLAEQKNKRFSAELKHDKENCGFCRYLVESDISALSSSQINQISGNVSLTLNSNPLESMNINNNNNNTFSINLNNTNMNNNFNSHFNIGSNQNHRNQNSSNDSYSLWKIYHASKIPLYKNLGSLSFDWNKFTSAPAKELLRLMITIIVEENLIFKEFDPDFLIQFMQHITTKCCKDNVRTAHELVSLNFLLNTYFKNWISRKIDRFVLYMATFLYNTDSSIAFDLIDDIDDFSQATEKVWFSSSSSSYVSSSENNNNNNNDDDTDNINNDESHLHEDDKNNYNADFETQNENDTMENSEKIINNDDDEDSLLDENEEQLLQEKNNLKLNMKAFQDQESVIERNIDFILNLFTIFIPTPKEKAPLVEQFVDTLTEIMTDVQDSKQFELLGEFSCRIESKYFSVSTDRDDRILFMKALIMLSHFCPYWSDAETMLKATERLNHSIFGTNDNENIPEFHYEHSTKIVAPWVSVFMNFSPMDQVVYNLKVNINYWKNKMS